MIEGRKTRLRAIEMTSCLALPVFKAAIRQEGETTCQREDIPRFVKWFNNPEVRHYLDRYFPMSTAEEEKWFEGQLEDRENKVFAIETAEGVHI